MLHRSGPKGEGKIANTRLKSLEWFLHIEIIYKILVTKYLN